MRDLVRHVRRAVSSNYPLVESLIQRLWYQRRLRRIVRGNNNSILYRGAVLSSVTFDIKGNDNRIEIMEGTVLNNVVFYIRGYGHRVSIGPRCRFNQGGSIWFEDSNCVLSIGENTTFENVHLALTEPNSRMTIGADCMLAYDIDIRTGDSHSIISQITNKRINYAGNVTIGNHVWIAAHCILLKGCVIPSNSVVATASVVTGKYTKEGIIIGGNPATILERDITWSRKRIYETT